MDVAAVLDRLHPVMGDRTYVFGGTVRDILRGAPIRDIDLVCVASPLPTPESLRSVLGGTAMHVERPVPLTRVICDEFSIDVQRTDDDIETFLRVRDFTINAMAVLLARVRGILAGVGTEALLDPTGGRNDLAARVLRMTTPAALHIDPARALRALVLVSDLGFGAEKRTTSVLAETAGMMSEIPGTNRTTLLLSMMGGMHLSEAMDLGCSTRLLQEAIGTEIHRESIVQVKTLREIFHDIQRTSGAEHVKEPIVGSATRADAVLLGSLSRGEVGDLLEGFPRKVTRIFRAIADAAREASIDPADVAMSPEPLAMMAGSLIAGAVDQTEMARIVVESLRRAQAPPLVRGEDALAIGIAPGPAIGIMLRMVRRAQMSGEVRTRAEARRMLRTLA